jgi:uncharacterized protein YjdB
LFAIASAVLVGCGDNRGPSVATDKDHVEMPVGVTETVAVSHDGGDTVFDPELTWVVDDPSIANVAPSAGALAISGRAVGTTTAHASYYGQAISVAIDVSPAALVGLTLSSAAITTPVGLDKPLFVLAKLTDGSSVDISAQVTWTIDDDTLLVITDGVVKGLRTGSTLAHAHYMDQVATASITVTGSVLVGLTLDPPSASIPIGLSTTYTAAGVMSDNTVFDASSQVSWSVDRPAIASIDRGRATGKAAGTAQVLASMGETAGGAQLTVTATTVDALLISPVDPSIPVNHTQQLRALVKLSDGNNADVTGDVTWSSGSPAIATVDAHGVVHGVALGTSVITATLASGRTATVTVTVTSATLTRVDVSPNPVLLAAGSHRQATATGIFSDGVARDVTAEAVWASNRPTIATVASGDIVGQAAGTATITATVSGQTGTTTAIVTSAQVASITVIAPHLTMPIGTFQQLQAIATYTDGTTQDVTNAVLWLSDSPLRIGVSNLLSHGIATALTPGAARITASLGLLSGSVNLTATTATLVRLEVSPATLGLAVGASQQATVTAVYSDGTTADVTNAVLWSSSSTAIATVANAPSGGTVTGKAVGTATITAQLGTATVTLPVTVTAATLTSLQVTPDLASVAAGGQVQLAAAATYSDGTRVDVTSQVVWSSSVTAVATVANAAGSNGKVSALAVGSSTITATLAGQTASASITVTSATLTEIQLTPAALTLGAGASADVVATGVYSDGSTRTITADVSWSSNAAAVATVSAGHVVAVTPGVATLTATLAGVSATAAVVVTGATVVGLEITPPSATIPLLQTAALTANGTLSDGSSANVTQQATWTSSNPLVASVSNASGTRGQVTGLLPGTATITATVNGRTATTTVTVTVALLVSAQLSPATVTLPSGTSLPLSVIGTFSDGSTADLTSQASFSSSNSAVAAVAANGIVTANASGAATITATVGLVSATATVTVNAAVVTGLEVSPTLLALPLGVSQGFTATGTFSDGTRRDVTGAVTWTSLLPAVATVSNVDGSRGQVASHALGATTITATINGVSATAALTITPAQLSQLQLTPATLSLPAGITSDVIATGVYSDGSTHDLTALVGWGSSDPAIATVSIAGRVTAVAAGSATITATIGGVSQTLPVAVTAATLVSLAITPLTPSGVLGQTVQLTATGTYSDGTTVNVTQQASWSSSNILVATVQNLIGQRGRVLGLLPGTATVTASLGGQTATTTFTVTAAVLTGLQINPLALNLSAGTSAPISVLGIYSDGSIVDLSGQASFSSTDSQVASVAANGTVSALAAGTATISATVAGQTATVNVNVSAATLAQLEVTPVAVALPLGITAQLTATAVYSDGTHTDVTSDATWTSSVPAVATVSNVTAGKVTSQAIGATTITAMLNGMAATAVVTVTPAQLAQLQVTPGTLTLPAGLSADLVATGVYSDGSTHDLTALVGWTSSAPATASVLVGHVTAGAPGSATITAGLGALSATTSVTIAAADLQAIAITPSAPSVAVGQTVQLTATGTYSDGSSVNLTSQVTWGSSNLLVALVSGLPGSQGRVTGLLPGTADATATLGGVQASATVTVSAAVLSSLAISPGTVTLPSGLSAPLAVIGTYSNGTTVDLSSQAIWTSSAPGVATVSASGTVTGQAAGTTTITASVGGLSTSATIAITAATLTSLQVAPLAAVLPLGISTQLTATGVYSDGSHTDLTDRVTWTSSLPAFASVSNVAGARGKVTSQALGATTITAALDGASATALVTVTPGTLAEIQLTPSSLALPAGISTDVVATGVYSDGTTHDLSLLAAWSSSAPAIVSVLAGHVTALAPGSATVTVNLGGVTQTLPVTVSAAQLGELAIDPPHPTLSLGQGVNLTATGTYSDNSTADVTAQVLWQSSNPLVASVSNLLGTRGRVTGLLGGTATITATLAGATTSVVITVTPALLLSLQVAPATVTMPAGLTQQLTVTGTYSDLTTQDLTAQATWTSSAPTTASVSNAGLVAANASGSATITATVGARSATSAVTVSPAVLTALQLAPSSVNLPLGATARLTATGVYSDGSHADATASVTWTSDSPAIASVSNVAASAGKVTSNAQGDTTVRAALGGVAASAPVHVGSASLVSVNVVGQDGQLPLGLSTQLRAFGNYTDGSVVDLTSLATFASSTPAITVSNAVGTRGLALAAGLGQSVVSATVAGVTGELTLGTTSAQLTSIDVSSVPALPLGLSASVTATGHYSDGTTADLTSQVTWTSSAPAVASVANGVVTSLGLGSTTITASLGGVSGSTTVGSSAANLSSISVAPTTLSLALGLTSQLTATGHYTDGSTVDLTSQATWTSDNALIAGVSNALSHGVVTALLGGTAHITATLNGVASPAATVTVTSAILQSITVTPAASTVALGQIAQLTATARYSDGTLIDVTSAAAWLSSNATNVSVSNLTGSKGAATGLNAGTATLSATLGLVTGSTGITVAQGCHLVINEVKTGTLLNARDEFVEVLNPCSFAIDVSRSRLAYRLILGLADLALVDLTGTMAPGSYRVYSGPAYTGSSNGTLVTDLAALGGGIAIRDIPSSAIIDSMGYGTAVNLFVEGLVALALPTGKSLSRLPNGTDTNNNAADFAVTTPTPGAANVAN